jgi:drug/metabolite transporter (DMT)-like permease
MLKHSGEIAALFTAMFWTITALAFEAAGRKIGSLIVNLLRLLVGFFFLSLFTWIFRGYLLPVDASSRTWLILILSGLVGFTFGDLCLFQSFVVIGARLSMLLMALAPPMTAMISWIILGEKMTRLSILGMIVTITGIALVVLKREDTPRKPEGRRKFRFNYPFWGILLGLGGAFGQSLGLVLSKLGMREPVSAAAAGINHIAQNYNQIAQSYNPFASAQIRVIAGIAGFVILFTILCKWKPTFQAFSNHKAMWQLSLGGFFGPFLGVSFSLLAVQLTNTGIASTIMAMVPVIIIPPSIILFKEKVTLKEIAGAILAVSGVALFFL